MNEKQKEKNMIDNTETNNTDTLGKRIMALRKAAGMTQEQVAERLGVSPQAVSKWENDVSCPDVTMIPRIAQLFNVSTDELLGLKASTVRPADTSSYSHGNGDCCKFLLRNSGHRLRPAAHSAGHSIPCKPQHERFI